MLTVDGKPRKNLNQKIDPTGDLTRTAAYEVTLLPLNHSGGHVDL